MQFLLYLTLAFNFGYYYNDAVTTESHDIEPGHYVIPNQIIRGYITIQYKCGYLYEFNFTYAWYGDPRAQIPKLVHKQCSWVLVEEDLLEIRRHALFDVLEYNFTQRYWLHDDGYSPGGAGWNCEGNCRLIDRYTQTLDDEPKTENRKYNYGDVVKDSYFSYVLRYRPAKRHVIVPPLCVTISNIPIVAVKRNAKNKIIPVKPLEDGKGKQLRNITWKGTDVLCQLSTFCYKGRVPLKKYAKRKGDQKTDQKGDQKGDQKSDQTKITDGTSKRVSSKAGSPAIFNLIVFISVAVLELA